MHNSKLGKLFEERFTQYLYAQGYWVTFLERNRRGQQPFDFIGAKDGNVIVGDCKTCKAKYISIKRLEFDQIASFEKYLKRGNSNCIIAVEHNNNIYKVDYVKLKELEKIYFADTKNCTLLDVGNTEKDGENK